MSPRCHLFRLSHPEVQCRLFPRYRLVRLSAQCHPCHLFPPVYLVPQCHQIMIGMNFFYFEFGYSVGGSLVFGFTIMYGLGTLISEASFEWLSSKFTRNQIITAATIITVIGYMLFMSVGYILPKSIVLLNIIGFLIFFSQGTFNMTMIVMLNNTIEYDEVRFHERHDSIISAVRSFATKLASAVDQAVVALILIISNIYAISQKNIIDERKYEELVVEIKSTNKK